MKIFSFFFFFLIIFNEFECKSQYSFINQYTNFGTPRSKGHFCTQLSDGSFLIAASGYDETFQDTNLFILKLNSMGDTIWTKSYNFSNEPEIPTYVLATEDSGFMVTGNKFIL